MLRMNLAILYLDSNRPNERSIRAKKRCASRRTRRLLTVTLGRCYFASGEEEKAASEYEAAAKLDPQDGEAYFALGQMRMFQRRTKQAEESLRQAIQLSPQLGPAYAELARILMSEGKNSEARGLLEKAVSLNTQDWQSQYELAVLLNQAGETARATKLLDKVLQVNPDFPGAHEQLATGLLRRGDVPGATAMAGKMMPRIPRGRRVIASWLWRSGNSAITMARSPNAPWRSMPIRIPVPCWPFSPSPSGRRDARKMRRRPIVMRAKVDPKVGTADVFCRLLLCDARDIAIVSEFLRKNRWVLEPKPQP